MISGVATILIMPVIGKLSDKFNKYIVFAIASVWLMVVVLVYTNLSPVHIGIVMMVNIFLMIGIMSRMVPSMALISTLPKMTDRGAFMSVNSSLQSVAGGIAAAFGGLIVVQKTKTSPLEHYDIVGYVVIVIAIICVALVYKVNKIVTPK